MSEFVILAGFFHMGVSPMPMRVSQKNGDGLFHLFHGQSHLENGR